jgi:NAD(P)H dehydrogenase (quinone)
VKALVVLAHPVPGSLNHQLCDDACSQLAAAGHAVTRLDLHEENFDPRLSRVEREAYHSDDLPADPALARHHVLLRQAEVLVLVFPTWWFGPPAILKGWFDRAFSPGIAFRHTPDFGPIEPALTKLRHVVIVTTLGSPWWVDRLVMQRPVRRQIGRALVGACAPRAKVSYLPFHLAENPAPERLARFRRKLAARLVRL